MALQHLRLVSGSVLARVVMMIGLFLASEGPALADGPLDVVVTIRPIHSLASAILEGVATPKLLLQGASSPHDYALKPSDAQALAHARVIIRVSENLETFLNKPLEALAQKATIVTLEQTPGLQLLPVRHWSDGKDEDDDGHHHLEGGADVHFWLDPLNAIVMVEALTRQFSSLDPAHAALFAANSERLIQKLKALDDELKAQFEPVKNRPFVVFHDVLHYLENRYGLSAVGAVTLSPEQQPGARHVSELRSKIKALNAVCVFREPQFPPKLVAALTQGTQAYIGVVDEIGVDQAPGSDHYAAFMRANADHIVKCLAASQK